MRMVGAAGLLVTLTSIVALQGPEPAFVPVGVVMDSPADLGSRKELEYLRTLRFNVVARRDPAAPLGMRVDALTSLLAAESTAPPQLIAPTGLEIMNVDESSRGAEVRQQAWMAIGRGVRGVLFNGWRVLRQNPGALAAAASFADNVTRNAALFAPLRGTSRDIRLDAPPSAMFARFVESSEALVLVAANLTASTQKVTLTFSPEIPEAIWQNMESGAAVNFVAGVDGPTYTRVFTAHDVIVLMIRKQYK